ncbi:hypothetical protein J6590_075081 [Homalodisca vitripennis]|nr:hypothetical protein J6590_089317 [Homalodisca vitripennis]KAG8290810.1 hypothetical protein J6590_075081 [Homalodisca vitripennis]
MPVAWALLVFCVQAYFAVLFYLWKAMNAAAWSTFNRCLESIFELIILTTMFHGALATWIDTPKIIEAVNRLNLFNSTTTILDHEVINTYRSLWVELHSCTTEMTDAMGRTIQLWHVTNFLISVFSTYGLLVGIMEHDLNMIYVLDAFIHAMINFYVVFTFSHYAQNCVSA